MGRRGGVALPQLPRFIFLDTNVVQYLQTFGEYIYDNYLAPEYEKKLLKLGKRVAQDVEALAIFMDLGRRNGWPLAVSRGTPEELAATPEPGKRYYLTHWGGELADYCLSNIRLSAPESSQEEEDGFSHLQRASLSEFLSFLPQESDRQLLIDARELGCDVFVTMDYRTIWRFRHQIKPFGLEAMRPVELVDYLRPWVGLLR